MKKRNIKQDSYNVIHKEIDYLEQQGIITALQKEEMLNQYTIKAKMNPMRLLLMIGLILLAIGVTTFIAGKLLFIGDSLKIALIMLGIVILHFIGVKTEISYPKTSKTMHYAGVGFLGAGIYLIQNIYHVFNNDATGLMIWVLGILSHAVILKDRNILIFSSILIFIYGNSYFAMDEGFPYILMMVIPIMYLINTKVKNSNFTLYFLNIISIQLIVIDLDRVIGFDNAKTTLINTLILLLVGISMVLTTLSKNIKPIFEREGYVLHGVIGIYLSFPDLWKSAGLWEYSHLLFISIYGVFIILLMKKGSLIATFILSVLILRVYFTFALLFIPDSIAYVLSGFIFIACGFYSEKKRKLGGKQNE